MKEFIKVITSRRSIRRFVYDKKVKDEEIEAILRCAMSAPSAGNQQPWHFVVVKDRATLDKIPDIHPHAMMCLEAPLAILICADLSSEKHKGFWVQDCSAACENMLLGIHSIGLGAVWVGIYPNQMRVRDFKELFSLPEHIIPFCLVPLGYPNEERVPENRFKEERIHFESW